jgi:histidinol-phosphate phosphatase family protein
MSEPSFDLVIPTAGRRSLATLVGALRELSGPRPGRILVVDDSGGRATPLGGGQVEILAGRGAGPAAARNVGWRASEADWVVFLDDDVLPRRDWLERLVADLSATSPLVGGSQGRVRVPLSRERRPTDWERQVAGLERAAWATADMAYRRAVLTAVGGFDERFPRAFREDADLALRVQRAGYELVRGEREVAHPVRAAGPLESVRRQAGNRDDVLMRALHGPGWRDAAAAPRGRLPLHLATTVAAALTVGGMLGSRRTLARAGLAGWLATTGELAWARIAPGPRTRSEVATMLATSALIPPLAAFHWMAGHAARRGLLADSARAPRRERPAAVLLDRDGTLVHDVPYNGDPLRVVAVPGARTALDRLRAAGVRVAVVSNQSGVGRGLLEPAQVEAVNRRVEQLLGPIESWAVCLHGPEEACACRKPAPGLVLEAAAALGVDPARCVVIGDIGSDVEAARAAGARAILVPTPATRSEEVRRAPEVAATLTRAVDLVLGGPA